MKNSIYMLMWGSLALHSSLALACPGGKYVVEDTASKLDKDAGFALYGTTYQVDNYEAHPSSDLLKSSRIIEGRGAKRELRATRVGADPETGMLSTWYELIDMHTGEVKRIQVQSNELWNGAKAKSVSTGNRCIEIEMDGVPFTKCSC